MQILHDVILEVAFLKYQYQFTYTYKVHDGYVHNYPLPDILQALNFRDCYYASVHLIEG